jgi:hypothetical protein
LAPVVDRHTSDVAPSRQSARISTMPPQDGGSPGAG